MKKIDFFLENFQEIGGFHFCAGKRNSIWIFIFKLLNLIFWRV